MDERHELKKAKYTDLVAECTSNRWKVHCMPLQPVVSSVTHSTSFSPNYIGAGSRVRRRVANDATTAASHSSAGASSQQAPDPPLRMLIHNPSTIRVR